MTAIRTAVDRRRDLLRRLGLVLACAVAVAVLAVVVPLAQKAWRAEECASRGGRLVVSTEDLQPLLVSRTVYVCSGPGGAVLATWW